MWHLYHMWHLCHTMKRFAVMKASQKIALEMSTKREALNALLGEDELSDEQRAEMSTLTERLQQLETEARAAIMAEDVPTITTTTVADGEGRELRSLIDRANVGNIFECALEHRATDGVESELQTHFKLAANSIPLAMLETRAVTPAPGQVAQNQSTIIPGVFPMSCAAFLSVDTPTVPTGESVYPVLTTNADVGTPAENAVQAETTGAFSASVLSPSRLQASFFYSREDRARFSGMSEALRMNLSDALADGLDKQILTGAEGLLTGTKLPNHNSSAQATYAHYRSELAYGRVDGTFAGSVSDLKIVMGAASYGHAASQFRSANAGDRAALEDLMSVTGGVKVSAHVPGVASKKQLAVIRLGSRRDCVAPIWEGITLIPDEITKAGAGQIVITAVMLHAVKVLRVNGFYKQQLQVEA